MGTKGLDLQKKYLKLQMWLAAWFTILAVLTAGVMLAVLFSQIRTQIREDFQARLKDMAAIAALQVDAEIHSRLSDPSQEGNLDYLTVKEVLQKIRDNSSDVRFIYTLRQLDDENIIFVVDAETDPDDISHLGDVYDDAGPTLVSSIDGMNQPEVEQDFYTDKWGTWLTGYAPVFTADGRLEAVLGIDIAAAKVIQHERKVLWSVLVVFAFLIPVVAVAGWLVGKRLASPIERLTEGATKLATGDLRIRVDAGLYKESASLARAFNAMADRLRELVESLEKRVAERTREVELRSSYLEAAAEVGRAATSILDPEMLIRQVVEYIRTRFGLYYVGLFLLDQEKEWAVLRAGTGEAGKKMLMRGHRIKIGEGMIGWSVENSLARIALEAERDAVRLATAELPNTRSEAALPLRSRGQVIGALSVQSDRYGAFDESTIVVLQTMADQVGVALDNARLFAESSEAFQAIERSYSELTRTAWLESLQQRITPGYHCDWRGVVPLDAQPEDSTVLGGNGSALEIPLLVRGQSIGSIQARKSETQPEWSEEELALMRTLTEQLGVALENARLHSTTRKVAVREHVLAEITSKLRSSTNLNLILQTALQELVDTLQVAKGSIHLRKDYGDQINE